MIASTQTNHPLSGTNARQVLGNHMDQALAKLKQAGLRITQPRIAILTSLLKRDQPCSIEQIHGDLATGSCDLVTVYRCLTAFEEIGLVRRTFFLNGTSLYTIKLNDTNRYHVVNKDTREARELDAESIAELQATVQRIEERLRHQGHANISHVVEFFAESASMPSRGQSPTRVV
ncbi:MAG: transcriptional repressor [Opitutaceae bacterium]|nr:transcriptional repressor [Opitutaceae bacterium]